MASRILSAAIVACLAAANASPASARDCSQFRKNDADAFRQCMASDAIEKKATLALERAERVVACLKEPYSNECLAPRPHVEQDATTGVMLMHGMPQ